MDSGPSPHKRIGFQVRDSFVESQPLSALYLGREGGTSGRSQGWRGKLTGFFKEEGSSHEKGPQ